MRALHWLTHRPLVEGGPERRRQCPGGHAAVPAVLGEGVQVFGKADPAPLFRGVCGEVQGRLLLLVALGVFGGLFDQSFHSIS